MTKKTFRVSRDTPFGVQYFSAFVGDDINTTHDIDDAAVLADLKHAQGIVAQCTEYFNAIIKNSSLRVEEYGDWTVSYSAKLG